MLVSCSEINVSVIVKYVQHIGIIRAFCLPEGDLLSFSVPGGTENKPAGLWFAGEKGEGWEGVSTWAFEPLNK